MFCCQKNKKSLPKGKRKIQIGLTANPNKCPKIDLS